MDFRVNYSEQAVNDLTEIIRYISNELCNPQSAENFFKAMNKKLALLREHPYMFPLYHDEELSAKGYRFASIGNYLIFYLVIDESSIVNIARILYGKRDISLVLM